MTTHRMTGHVDQHHRLLVQVPESIPPGPVEITIESSEQVNETDETWASAIAREWSDELADTNQDIYSLDDGEPLDAA